MGGGVEESPIGKTGGVTIANFLVLVFWLPVMLDEGAPILEESGPIIDLTPLTPIISSSASSLTPPPSSDNKLFPDPSLLLAVPTAPILEVETEAGIFPEPDEED